MEPKQKKKKYKEKIKSKLTKLQNDKRKNYK